MGTAPPPGPGFSWWMKPWKAVWGTAPPFWPPLLKMTSNSRTQPPDTGRARLHHLCSPCLPQTTGRMCSMTLLTKTSRAQRCAIGRWKSWRESGRWWSERGQQWRERGHLWRGTRRRCRRTDCGWSGRGRQWNGTELWLTKRGRRWSERGRCWTRERWC